MTPGDSPYASLCYVREFNLIGQIPAAMTFEAAARDVVGHEDVRTPVCHTYFKVSTSGNIYASDSFPSSRTSPNLYPGDRGKADVPSLDASTEVAMSADICNASFQSEFSSI